MTSNKIIKQFFSTKKSKYFKFITDDSVISQVISYNGSIIPLPKEWTLKKVKVLFDDGTEQEYFVKDGGNICYISVAKIFLGSDVAVSLIDEKDDNNSSILGKAAIGLVYSVFSVYLVVIVSFQFT